MKGSFTLMERRGSISAADLREAIFWVGIE
jgi:deoxyhypusine synthase